MLVTKSTQSPHYLITSPKYWKSNSQVAANASSKPLQASTASAGMSRPVSSACLFRLWLGSKWQIKQRYVAYH